MFEELLTHDISLHSYDHATVEAQTLTPVDDKMAAGIIEDLDEYHAYR